MLKLDKNKYREDQPAADREVGGWFFWGGAGVVPSCPVLSSGPRVHILIDAWLLGNAYHPDCHMGDISHHTL